MLAQGRVDWKAELAAEFAHSFGPAQVLAAARIQSMQHVCLAVWTHELQLSFAIKKKLESPAARLCCIPSHANISVEHRDVDDILLT